MRKTCKIHKNIKFMALSDIYENNDNNRKRNLLKILQRNYRSEK